MAARPNKLWVQCAPSNVPFEAAVAQVRRIAMRLTRYTFGLAVKTLDMALRVGQKRYVLGKMNVAIHNEVLESVQFDQDAKSEIVNALSAGKTVKVHERPININGWIGSGYVVLDSETGSGAYKRWASPVDFRIWAWSLLYSDPLLDWCFDTNMVVSHGNRFRINDRCCNCNCVI